ncbi:unnamed protein product [Acanthosepion pharaonis]|uniref:Uncharacterized protein n=1 Tax=Acanthosepion pharaonis TaxID=158019 RepID=A0A812C5X8_ACAPH|nr:unnamed protein product [Sepia pharaonis]
MPSGTPLIYYSFVNSFLSSCLPDPVSFDILFGNPFVSSAFWNTINFFFFSQPLSFLVFMITIPLFLCYSFRKDLHSSAPQSFVIPTETLFVFIRPGTEFLFYSYRNPFRLFILLISIPLLFLLQPNSFVIFLDLHSFIIVPGTPFVCFSFRNLNLLLLFACKLALSLSLSLSLYLSLSLSLSLSLFLSQ